MSIGTCRASMATPFTSMIQTSGFRLATSARWNSGEKGLIRSRSRTCLALLPIVLLASTSASLSWQRKIHNLDRIADPAPGPDGQDAGLLVFVVGVDHDLLGQRRQFRLAQRSHRASVTGRTQTPAPLGQAGAAAL